MATFTSRKLVAFLSLVGGLTLALSACGSGCSCERREPPVASPADPGAPVSIPGDAAPPATVPAIVPSGPKKAIRGSVRFLGAAPKPEPITMTPECNGEHGSSALREDVVVTAGGAVQDVLVRVKDGLPDEKSVPGAAVVVDQKGCRYVPHVIAVLVNQQVIFRNSDPTTHNVNASPAKSAAFNQGQPPRSDDIVRTFKTAELSIPVKCDIHPWMSAVVHVSKHPYFALTDARGEFELPALPPGKYTIEAVHPVLGTVTAAVDLSGDIVQSVDLSFGGK